MMFKGTKSKSEGTPDDAFALNWSKIIRWFIRIVAVVLLLSNLLWQGMSLYQGVSANWAEIKFAYEKPALVKSIRLDYQKKQAQLDTSFTQKQSTKEEKLSETVINQAKVTNAK